MRRATTARRARRRADLARRQRLAGDAGSRRRSATACTPARVALRVARRPPRGERRRLERRRRSGSSAGARRRRCSPCRCSSPRGCSSTPPAALARRRLRRMRYAPWLVANLHLDAALDDQPGRGAVVGQRALYGSAGARLRRCDAPEHCCRTPVPTVLTRLLGARRRRSSSELRARSADACSTERLATWADAVVHGPRVAHPDLAGEAARVDLMRYGHAMSIPIPGAARQRGAAGARRADQQRACSSRTADLSAYSVFEEAFFHGTRAGRTAATTRGAAQGSARCATWPPRSNRARPAYEEPLPTRPPRRSSNGASSSSCWLLLERRLRGGALAVPRRGVLGRRCWPPDVRAAVPQVPRSWMRGRQNHWRRWRRSG